MSTRAPAAKVASARSLLAHAIHSAALAADSAENAGPLVDPVLREPLAAAAAELRQIARRLGNVSKFAHAGRR